MKHRHHFHLALITGVLLLAGCTSSESVGGTPPPVIPAQGDIIVTGVVVRGSTPANAVVTVRGVADQDGVADRSFAVGFRLDGGTSPTSLARDPGLTSGQTWNTSLPIVSTAAGTATTTDLIITLAP